LTRGGARLEVGWAASFASAGVVVAVVFDVFGVRSRLVAVDVAERGGYAFGRRAVLADLRDVAVASC